MIDRVTCPHIAILGATSHIAKGLVHHFLDNGGFFLHLFARSAEKISLFLATLETGIGSGYQLYEGYDEFLSGSYDVIINCVGAGTLNRHKGDYTTYFTITEEYDNLAIEYLCSTSPDSLYISLSSGAVYGRGHMTPVVENSAHEVMVNHVRPEDYYSIVRLYTETKHRAFHWLNIIDLRIFSYFSRYIDLTDGYFITDLIASIKNNKTLVTDGVNIVRDYLHPSDLFSIILICMNADKTNAVFDVVSSNPVEKSEILAYFSETYGLAFEVVPSRVVSTATGSKNIYCSRFPAAQEVGYSAKFSSMETLMLESGHILK
jgi:nucleoside-diphosphate-sugar epimerase